MSLAQRFERRLESVVGSAFARVFKGQVEPVEIGNALQREASDKRAVMGNGKVFAPNRYRISLAATDYDRLTPWELQLTNSLAELVQENLDQNGWTTVGDIEVYLHRDETLHTGVFGIASRMESEAPPRRRPFDSLSLPAVEGAAPGDYPHPFNPNGDLHGQGYPDPAGPAPFDDPYGQGPPHGGNPYDQGQGYPAPQGAGGYDQGGNPYEQGGNPYEQGAGFGAPVPAPPAGMGAAAYAAPPQFGNGAQQQSAPPPYQPPPPPPRQQQLHAWLVVDGTDQHLALRQGSNLLGRGHDCDLQLLDQGVSRRHVDVQFDGQHAVAYDLGSTNGTSVNGHFVGSHQLQHGDVLRVGHSRLVFQQEVR
ncbi:MAG: FhaA domain-containing protein [Jatrophihabitans sp.]